MWYRSLFVLHGKALAVESQAFTIQSTYKETSDLVPYGYIMDVPQIYIEPSASRALKDLDSSENSFALVGRAFAAHMPPATKLTIRDPGIFTSTGYGMPFPMRFGSFLRPSLPLPRSLRKKGTVSRSERGELAW